MRDINEMGKQAASFAFTSSRYDPVTGEATLSYQVDGRVLQERITFPGAPWPRDADIQMAFNRALELLHLIAGVSYYKAGLAPHIDTGVIDIDQVLAGFLNDLYIKGLAEFAHVNQLDLTGLIDFSVNSKTTPGSNRSADDLPDKSRASGGELTGRALVAIGGGKDSLVCLQMLRAAGIEVQPVCVGGSELIGQTVEAAGLSLLRISRDISAELSDMNTRGAWNGHVPVTAINSAILLCAGLLYDYRNVVFANESSANEATLVDESGVEVNHQYSKSFEFEKAFRRVIRHRIHSGIEYFSLLRPFSEIAITGRFAGMTLFHRVFSSCNRNFHQDGSRITGRWCQDCPKCRFTALALALFIDAGQLRDIQGVDMLDQESQLQGFKALCGLGEQKPFECVGSVGESRAAIRYLTAKPGYRDMVIVGALSGYPEIDQSADLALEPDFVAPHCIPAEIMAKLNAV